MPEKSATTHVLLDRQLVIYRRERSTTWQCRFKVGGIWHRATTGERELERAKANASRLLIAAEVRKENNLSAVTRKFRDVARLAIRRMEEETASNQGKVSYTDYIRVINDYLIPILGNYHITSIDSSVLNHLDAERIKKMGKAPSKSTLLTHNAALNRVFDEAMIRNFLTDANRPQLESKGRVSDKRPAFELKEVQALLAKFDPWIDRARTQKSKELRQLLHDYAAFGGWCKGRNGDQVQPMKPAINNATCTEYQTLVREMMLESEPLRSEFDLAWIRQKEWEVVPVERAQHFIPEEIKAIVSALAGRGCVQCIAVATEELGPLPSCFDLSVSEEDFYEFNKELGLFRCLLTDQDRSWAISCTESYNLFAGPASLIEAMLEKSVEDAWKAYWEFIAQPSVDPYGMLHQSATRYAVALSHPVEPHPRSLDQPKAQ